MKTLIKNGTLITASETFQADILIEDRKNHVDRPVASYPGRRACGCIE